MERILLAKSHSELLKRTTISQFEVEKIEPLTKTKYIL